MARHQFAQVVPGEGGVSGIVVLSDTGHVSFYPASSVRGGQALVWDVMAPSVAAGKAEAFAHHGSLDWRDIPDDEPDPVSWASMRVAAARSFGG